MTPHGVPPPHPAPTRMIDSTIHACARLRISSVDVDRELWELDARERGRPRSSRTRRTRRRRETIDEEERRVHSFIHSSVPFRFVIDFDFDFDRTIGRLDDVSERRRVNRAEGEVAVRVNRRTSSRERAGGANA